MNHKNKSSIASMGSLYPGALILFTDSWYVLLPSLAVQFGCVAWSIRLFIKGDPEREAERRLAASRSKTAELEADLGYEPLNLHELDDLLLDDQGRRKESS